MSVKIMGMVWQNATDIQGNDLLVMLALADWSNDQGVCWPSVDRLAEKARVSVRTAQYILRRLCEAGYITVQGKGGRSHANNYILNLSLLIGRETVQDMHPLAPQSVQPLHPLQEERVQSTTQRVQVATLKGAIAIAPEPSIEPSVKEPSVKRAQPRKQKTQLPDDFEVTGAMWQWAKKKFPDLDIESATETWRDAMLAKGFEYIDWQAAWRTGMTNADKWNKERGGKQGNGTRKLQPTKREDAIERATLDTFGVSMEQIFGRANASADEPYSPSPVRKLTGPGTAA